MDPLLAPLLTALDAAHTQLRDTPDWNNPLAWRRLACRAGLPGADLPERVGGRNLATRAMIELFARCGARGLDLRDVPGGGHSRILLYAKTRHLDSFLCDVASARAFCAIAITEPEAGSDMHGLQTVALPTAGGYLLRGEKMFVARLQQATHVVVFAHVRRATMERTLTAFLVPLAAAGLARVELEGLGLNGVSFGGLQLDDVFVPHGQRIGGEGQGFYLFARHFTYWRTAMAAAAIGCARGALDQAMSWLRTRQAFGGPIGRFTHLQQELALHLARLHMAWLLVVSVAERIDARQPAFADAAMAKAEAVEIALAATDWAMRVHGAKSHTTLMDLERRLRDLQSLRIADGTTDVLRGQVARAALGDELYELALGRDRRLAAFESHTPARRYW